MVLEPYKQENNLKIVFLFSHALLSQAYKFYLIIFTAFSLNLLRRSREGKQGGAGWHPALLPIDSWTLIREFCIQNNVQIKISYGYANPRCNS